MRTLRKSLSIFASNVAAPTFILSEDIRFPINADQSQSWRMIEIAVASSSDAPAGFVLAPSIFTFSETPVQRPFLDLVSGVSAVVDGNGNIISGSSSVSWKGIFLLKPVLYNIQVVLQPDPAFTFFQCGVNFTLEYDLP